ncbi:NfeD family protein [Paenibacillus chartarius]|uniref:NfeD family protein n=1 Tax=Paenibacillus chartarius TaxID=747481 RepID=A0ABV6DIA3_9BACL
MLTLYWICLITGVLLAVAALLMGEVLSHAFGTAFQGAGDAHAFPFLQPVAIVSGVTAFGACGLLLTRYTGLAPVTALILSAIGAIGLTLAIAFLYVRPMQRGENSTGFSEQDLAGTIGEITIPVPGSGYGEIMVKVGASFTNQIAASFDGVPIPAGSRAVVVSVRDRVLYVSPLGDELNS